MPQIRDLNALADYAHEQIERIERMQRDLAEYAGQARSPRGHAWARTGPGGALLELRIEPGAARLPVEDIAAEVAAAIAEAQQRYARHADEIMAPVLGLRPSDKSMELLERGMSRLDALTADLERLARSHNLTGD